MVLGTGFVCYEHQCAKSDEGSAYDFPVLESLGRCGRMGYVSTLKESCRIVGIYTGRVPKGENLDVSS